jgi:hypothetical protein
MGRTQVDEILEQCLAAIQTQGLTVEDCLRLYPAVREELEPLLSLAARLQTARSLRPAAEFKVAAARRLGNLAAARRARPRRKTGFLGFWTGSWAQPRMRLNSLLVGMLVMILIASGFGTMAASAQSLPGDFLYPVKRAEEDLQFALTLDQAGRAGLHLDHAGRRLDEAVALVQKNRTQALDQVLADYNDQLQSELTFLQPDSPLTAAQQLVLADRLLNEAQRQADGLDFVNRAAPLAAQARIEAALSNSQQAYNQAAKILQSSDSSQSIQPTPLAGTPILPATPTPRPTLSLTLQNSPTQRPSLSTPVPASSPSSLPPQATQLNSGPLPTNTVVRTPPFTPGISSSATRIVTLPPKPTSTLPPASNLPSPTGIKTTPRPTLSQPSQNSPTQRPSPGTSNSATRIATLPPEPTSTLSPANSLTSPTEVKVAPTNAPMAVSAPIRP